MVRVLIALHLRESIRSPEVLFRGWSPAQQIEGPEGQSS